MAGLRGRQTGERAAAAAAQPGFGPNRKREDILQDRAGRKSGFYLKAASERSVCKTEIRGRDFFPTDPSPRVSNLGTLHPLSQVSLRILGQDLVSVSVEIICILYFATRMARS